MSVYSPWKSLYRRLIREARALPDETTSEHFRGQIKKNFCKNSVYPAQHRQLLRLLQRANAGYIQQLQKCMQIAYGRRGKLARVRIEAILSQARENATSPLIPTVPRTKLPQYTPLMKSYLLCPDSHRKGKAPKSGHLITPPALPARADPNSEDARLLGPFSKRREANIRWRYLTNFRDKMNAPILSSEVDILSYQARHASKPLSKRQQSNATAHMQFSDNIKNLGKPRRITGRFMRRRYEELLTAGVAVAQGVNNEGRVEWITRQPSGLAKKPSATEEDLRWVID